MTTPDREAIIARLAAAFAEDRLSMDEYEQRVEAVYKAATPMALEKLTSDLPAPVAAKGEDAALSGVLPMAPRLFALLGSVERKGRLAVPRRLEVRALFANVEVDLREADFKPGVTEIAVRALFANVELILPEGVALEHHGEAILGSFATHAGPKAVRPPGSAVRLVRLTGRAVFGNVEVSGGSGEFGGAA